MKKLLFGTFVIVFTLSSVLVNAQAKKGAYVGVNVGYNAAGGAANLQSLQNFTQTDRKSTRLNSSHRNTSRMPSSA